MPRPAAAASSATPAVPASPLAGPSPLLRAVPTPATPIMKWVGGKKRMLAHITGHYTGQAKLVEPFLGGGAVAFNLASANPGLVVHANEKLTPVVEIYDAVRGDVEAFIAAVESFAGPYLASGAKDERRAFYYNVRDQYMAGDLDGPAPLFFMLWCAYSGLYRTGKNSNGRFNTPHGFGQEKPGFYKPDNLRAAAALMQSWSFTSTDFADTLQYVDADTFVFLDPPYRTTYTGYTADAFGDADQDRVVAYAHEAAARGARVVVTNKYTDDGWYEDNFAGFTIEQVPIKYSVNRNCADVGRPETFEAVIHNAPQR